MFPFQFQDKKYYGCLSIPNYENVITVFNYWCATEVDKDGVTGVTWGFCDPDCPTHEETLTWNTDTTVKMTLTYDNSILFIGLMLYGYLLAGIFTCGLLIVLVPAIGK